MPHSLCATEPCVYPHGWADWSGTSMHIRSVIDASVTHHQACGEAIRRWNEAVGARFLIVPNKGEHSITFLEAKGNEWPFTEWPNAAGLAYPNSRHVRIYVRSDLPLEYSRWVNIYAHEIGHAFSLADHPNDDINSIMSYQVSGRALLSPSREDVAGVAQIHKLPTIAVRPQDLTGIENITGFWHYDRYGTSGWQYWLRHLAAWSTLNTLTPYETYTVRAKEEGTLGYGRFFLVISPGLNRWMYL